MSEQRKYRTFTAQQKIEIVLAGIAVIGRSRRSAGSTRSLRRCTTTGATNCWRAARSRSRARRERSGEKELRRKIAELKRALGRKTYELEIAGKALRAWE